MEFGVKVLKERQLVHKKKQKKKNKRKKSILLKWINECDLKLPRFSALCKKEERRRQDDKGMKKKTMRYKRSRADKLKTKIMLKGRAGVKAPRITFKAKAM